MRMVIGVGSPVAVNPVGSPNARGSATLLAALAPFGRPSAGVCTPRTRTISALLTLREHVIAPIIAGLRSPRLDRKPAAWTPVDRDYEALRIDMQNLFTHLGITSINAAAAA